MHPPRIRAIGPDSRSVITRWLGVPVPGDVGECVGSVFADGDAQGQLVAAGVVAHFEMKDVVEGSLKFLGQECDVHVVVRDGVDEFCGVRVRRGLFGLVDGVPEVDGEGALFGGVCDEALLQGGAPLGVEFGVTGGREGFEFADDVVLTAL